MFKHVIFWGGLLLAFLLLGQLALNAAGVGNTGLEKSTGPQAGKTLSTKHPSVNATAEELQAKAAEEAQYRSDSRFYLSPERRKELEEAARLAGLDPNLMGDYSDSELLEMLKHMPSTSEKAENAPEAVSGSKDDPEVAKAMMELQEAEALKRSLEAEAGVASGPGASDDPLSGEAQEAALEAAEAAEAGLEMPVFEPTPTIEEPAVPVTSPNAEEALLQRIEAGEEISDAEKDAVDQYLSNQAENDRGRRGSLDNSGGPDAFGYRFVDDVDPDTATYDWIELKGDPLATFLTQSGTDGGTSWFLPGFSFPFYGIGRDTFRVSNDGNIQFTTNSTAYSNGTLPSTGIAGPVIFVFWDDQKTNSFGGTTSDRILYRNFGTYTVVEWDSMVHYSTVCDSMALKYEVILYNSGRIKMQYNVVGSTGTCDSSVTIGIQSNGAVGSAALQYCSGTSGTNFVGPHPVAERAIWFSPPTYTNNFSTSAITSPVAGTPYGGSQVLSVTATFLNLGSATQTAPVKYRFNNGTIFEETSAELDSLESDPHTFTTTITTPADTGNYPLWVWTDLATDENRVNDTLKINVRVFPGGSCEIPIEITTVGPDSATYNNVGAVNNTPGIPCVTNTYADMVFKKDVLADHTVTFWVSSLSWATKNMNAALRWSGSCPGDSLVKCVYNQSTAGPTGYNQKFIWTNMTGSTQTVYFTIGGYSSTASYQGAFKLAWKDTEYEHDFSVTAITSPLTSVYVPSEVVTVTGTAINLGSTEESSPIKYRFNAGGDVEEATASLVRFATESHSFATQITLPGVNGNYSLWVWTDLATDEDRANDTMKMTVKVFGGINCATVFELPALAWDSLTFNNCGADSNSPGAPCYPTSCFFDMVVKKEVAAGRTITFWVSSMSATSKYIVASMRWGGDCPGSNHIVCPPYSSSAPGINRLHMWTNTTGSTQWVYFTFGNYYGTASYCGNIKLAWKDEVCAAVDPPLTEGFEGLPAHMYKLPSCWTREDANTLSPIWECYTTSPRTGIYDVTIGPLTAGNNDWLFSPGINMEEGREYFVSYWRRVASATYPDSIEVRAGLAPTAAAMTIEVAAFDTCKRIVYTQKFGGFTCPASGVYYIGWHSMSVGASPRTYIDDIAIDASTSCTGGTVTVNSAIGADSVTLTAGLGGGWSGGMPRYQWYTGDTCTLGNQIPGATSSTYKTYVSGPFSCRVYIIDSLTCVACDSATATVVDCQIGAYGLSETFESVTTPALPVCWLQQNLDGGTYAWVTATTYPHTGTKDAQVYGYVAAGAPNDWLYSRPVQLASDTLYRLGYWFKLSSTSYTRMLEVMVGRDNVADSMNVAIVDTQFQLTSTTYDYHERTFQPPVTGVYYFGWHGTSASSQSGYIAIDDITVWPDGACTPPSSVTVNSVVRADSAKLKAVALGGTGGAYEYQWYTGDSCQTGNEIVGATIDSIWVFSSGIYSCKVWIVDDVECALCDSGYADVVDCGVPLTLPVSEGFESTTDSLLPVCWQWADVNGDGRRWKGFYSATYPPRTGMRNAYCTYSSGTAANDWMFTRGVALTGGDTIVVDYWYRCYLTGTSYSESLELLVGTAPDVVSMTTIVDTNFTFSAVATYLPRSGLFVVPATGTYYFGWHAGYLINQGGVMIDDIAMYEYGICAPPVVSVASADSQVYVTLTCTVTGGFGGPINYQWYTGDTCLTGNEIVGATGRQYTTFTSGHFSCIAWFLSADTCSDCDSAIATIIPDPCLPGLPPPIYEPWPGTGMPTCWSQLNGNGDSYRWNYSTTYYYSSPGSAYLYTSTIPANDWLFSGPVILTQDSTYRIEYYRRASSATYTQTLSLYVGTNRHSSFMTTELLAPYSFNSIAWIKDIALYTAPATGSYYFSLRNTTSVSSGSVYADDFRIYKVGDCGAPTTNNTLPGVGPDSARLVSRPTFGFGGTLQFRWYTGEICDPLNEIVGATDSVYQAPASGLYSCKAYYLSVDTCGRCDSAEATVIACAPNPYNGWPTPFTEGFEGLTTPQLPQCWRQQDANADARIWSSSASYYRTGTRSCYVIYGLTAGPQVDDWLYTKALALTAGDTMNVDYWYRTALTVTTETDLLEVYAGTGARNDFMTIVVDPLFSIPGSATYYQRQTYFVVPTTGTYYVGWHCASAPNMNGVAVDDIMIYKRGTCTAPTLNDIPAVVYPAWVTLTATASGGFGNPIQYQWYTGEGCSPGNAIGGATTYQYTTSVSGIFSCRASRDTCGVCDSAEVTITTPQAGEICSNAFTLTPPAHNDSSLASGTTVGFYSHYPETCGTAVSYSPDLFYTMTLPGSGDSACRRLTFVLVRSGDPSLHLGDPFLVIYDGLANCGNTALYCNDDDLQFTPLPPWDVPAQHPGWPSSYIAAEFYPGTYLIRVGGWVDSSGAYTLKVYDNGPCYEPCLEPDSLTVTMSPADPTKVWLHFYAPSIGTYKVFSTIQKNNDGNPNMGADPQWVLDTTFEVTTTGQIAWNDLRATVVYRNYAVQHDCPILGRCCYGPIESPSCVDNLQSECLALSGTWNRYTRCDSIPCPVGGNGETCATAIYVGPLPFVVTGASTAGYANDYVLYSDVPTCLSSSQSSYGNGFDVIYKITLTSTTNLTFLYGCAVWGSLTIHNACPAQGTCIAGIKDPSTTWHDLVVPCQAYAPGIYYVMVDSWTGYDPYTYNLTIQTCTP